MLTRTKNTFHPYPSLLTLQQALIAAESGVPAQPAHIDLNEQRAQQLITRVRAGYKKAVPLIGWHDIPSPEGLLVHFHEMADTHAR